MNKNEIRTLALSLSGLGVFAGLLQKPLFAHFLTLAECEEEGRALRAYGALVHEVYEKGGDFAAAVRRAVLEDENPYKTKGGRPQHSGRQMKLAAFSPEVDLRGMDSIEAIGVLQRYLDEAMRSNLTSVRIIHGKGTGTLRAAVHQELKRNKFIKTYRLGVYGEGEDGVTIAEFR